MPDLVDRVTVAQRIRDALLSLNADWDRSDWHRERARLEAEYVVRLFDEACASMKRKCRAREAATHPGC